METLPYHVTSRRVGAIMPGLYLAAFANLSHAMIFASQRAGDYVVTGEVVVWFDNGFADHRGWTITGTIEGTKK